MRIIYWSLTCLQPEIEAVSKEIFQLANNFKKSFIFGISPHYRLCCSYKNRYIGFNPRFDPLLRLIIPLLEQGCDINHVYGEPCPWIFYKTLKRKPLLLTIAAEKGMPRLDFLARCRKILVQTATFRQKLLALGVDKDRVEVAYPAVDLTSFRPYEPTMRLAGRPRVLFASAPRSEEEMKGRGVHLLLEAAKQSTNVHYRLLYRQWNSGYTSLKATQDRVNIEGLHNVMLTDDVVADMPSIYNQHHFTVIPYTTPDGGKECPNSLVEGLACGLPVLITTVSPFAYFVDENKCGVIFDPTPAGLVGAIEQGMSQYAELSGNAMRVAKEHFAEDVFLQRLERIYRQIMNNS
jgi:glycosyltransferase involved in cell wall biosynthesis